MATYNGQKFIKEQLKSILCQLKIYDEIIISDNFSNDKTLEIIESFKDNRIKIFSNRRISNNGRLNCIQNFENALSKCSGDYIFLSDQDDVWHPDKVKTCCEYLVKYDLIVSDCNVINEDDSCIAESYFKQRKSGVGLMKNLISNSYLGCCMVFKKEILNLVLPFPKSIPMHDIYIGFVAELLFKPLFLDNKLVSYRSHSLNVSSTSKNISKFNVFQRFLFRFNTIKQLPRLLFKYLKK